MKYESYTSPLMKQKLPTSHQSMGYLFTFLNIPQKYYRHHMDYQYRRPFILIITLLFYFFICIYHSKEYQLFNSPPKCQLETFYF